MMFTNDDNSASGYLSDSFEGMSPEQKELAW
jgi:hypothetical protein